MKHYARKQYAGAGPGRMVRACGALLALLAASLAIVGGCSEDVLKQFRTGAAGQLETGLKAILDGVVTGISNVVNPSANSGSSSNSSSSSSNSSSGATGGHAKGKSQPTAAIALSESR